MKKIILVALTLTIYMGAAYGAFKHPGIFSTKEQLEFVKKQIKNGKEPWASAYKKLVNTNPTERKPNPQKKLLSGTSSEARKMGDNMIYDGSHAYTSALLFYFSGEKKYADYAIKMLNAWTIFEKPGMQLYLSWGAGHFINAAELIKHTPGAGWKDADRKKFDKMVRNAMVPWLIHPKEDIYGANHGATAIESRLAAAVYLDDQKMFDDAIRQWKKHLPTYVYLNKPGRIDGQCQETCRDLNHTKLGLEGIMYAANTAYNQGIDLWKPEVTRFMKFAELHAGIMTGRTKVPNGICSYKGASRSNMIYCTGTKSHGNPPCNETAWEILYNHISRRLGKSLPHTKVMLERNRPLGSISRRAVKWETLLHANMHPDEIGQGGGNTGNAPTVSITKPANYSTFQLGTAINVNANAEDDGKISKVVFRIDGKDFSTDKKSPYSLTWTPKKIGKYKIEAEAYDDDNNKTISKSINVEIIDNSTTEPTIEMVEAEQAPNVASNLLDGFIDDDHRWSAEGYPKSVVIDYGEEKAIVGTNVYTYQGRSYLYTVSVSNNPDTGFVEVVNHTGDALEQPIAHSFIAVKGRYVKLTVTGANNYSNTWISINEFEIVEAELTPQSYTKNPTDDIYTENGSVNNTKELRVENDTRRRISYLKFDLSDVNGVISEAKLKLKETANEAGNGTIKVYLGSNSDWDERNTGTLPKKGKEVGEYNGNVNKNQEITINLEDLELDKYVTLIIEMQKGGNDVSFISNEGKVKPALEISTLKSTTLKSMIPTQTGSIIIYPNPVRNTLNIELDDDNIECPAYIQIVNMLGKVVKKQDLSEEKIKLDITELSQGMYIVEVKNGTQNYTTKFIKK